MTLSSATLIILFLWISCSLLIVRNLQLKRQLRRLKATRQEPAPIEAPLASVDAEPADRLALRTALHLAPGVLPAGGDWRAGDDLLLRIVEMILADRPSVVVELGCGLSTAVIARALERAGTGHLYSIEYDPTFADDTEDLLRRMELSDRVDLIEAPLEDRDAESKWYELDAIRRIPEDVDLLFVDGPPHFAGKAPRYPAGPELFHRITGNGAVILDDGRRSKEQKVLRMWARDFPEFEQIQMGTRTRAVMLRRRQGAS
ncbi:MAG: class I SAM-dependent methyltransferase [Pseudomonadota bacterium]